jgi:outer membrane protein assembly factor BamB
MKTDFAPRLLLFFFALAFFSSCGPKYPQKLLSSYRDRNDSPWTTYQGNQLRSSFSSERIGPPLGLVWRFETSAPITASPCIEGGLVYFGNLGKKLYILDAGSGKKITALGLEGSVSSSCALKDSLLFAATERGGDQLVAINLKNGDTVWHQLARDVSTSPLVTGDKVAVGTGDGYLLVFDVHGGELVWRFKTGGPIITSPAGDGQRIFCGSEDCHLYALDADSGELLWKFKAGGSISADPTVSDSLVFFGSTDSCLYALTVAKGRQLWRLKTGGEVFSSPAVLGGTLFFGSNDRKLYAVEIEKGESLWSFETGSLIQAPPLVTPDLVLCPSFDFHLYLLDIKTGRLLWKYRTEGMLKAPAVIYDRRIYLASGDGHLYCFAPKSSK